MKRIAFYFLMIGILLYSCGNVQQKPVEIIEEAPSMTEEELKEEMIREIASQTEMTEEEVKEYIEEIDNAPQTSSVFRPVSATISDSEGTFSSSNFDTPNMTVRDNGTYVQLSWGGENIPLYQADSPDTYIASQSKKGITMRFVAYRSSNTREIYLVICTTKGNGQSVEINFEP